jgi:CubicO group peptidase (beta-lactamase class C family)
LRSALTLLGQRCKCRPDYRRAAVYGFDEQGLLIKRLTWGGVVVEERPEDMTYESGSGGLWSTVDDYLKFARIVLEQNKSDLARRGSAGSVGWPGAYGGWWQADPRQGSVFIFLARNMVNLEQMARGVALSVWAALDGAQSISFA